MAQNFVRGDFGFFQFQAQGGALTVLCVTGHSLDIEVMVFEVVNTCSGGLMARIAGRTDVKGTVNADLDIDEVPYGNPPNVIPGTRGFAVFGLTTINVPRSIQVPCLIIKTHYEVAMNTQVKYSFDVGLDSRLGALVYA